MRISVGHSSRVRTGRTAVRLAVTFALVASALTIAPAPSLAQPLPFGQAQPLLNDTEAARLQREVRNPRQISALLQGRGQLEKNPDRAIDSLQILLDFPDDSPYSNESLLSIKDSAEQLLRSGGPELVDRYERRYAATAQSIINDASPARLLDAYREVASRFGLTSVGLDALQRLAIAAVDSGDSATAGQLCERLRLDPRSTAFEPRLSLIQAWALSRAGRKKDAEQLLTTFREAQPQGLSLNGETIPWFESIDTLPDWLDALFPPSGGLDSSQGLPYWEVAHGDLHRNGASPPAPPILDDSWSYPLVDEHDDYPRPDNVLHSAAILKDLDEKLRSPLTPTPVTSPLVVHDLLVFAGLGSVKAVSLKTGQLVWSARPVDDTLAMLFADTDQQVVEGKPELLKLLATQRMFRDLVHSSLSSDGRRVYRIGHGGLVGYPAPYFLGTASSRGAHPLTPRSYNSLQAYNVAGGKLLWEKGGPPRQGFLPEDEIRIQNDLVGAFFLGAPIPWSGQLLCLVEQGNQIGLVSLDPTTGDPLWMQGLLNSDPQENLQNAPERRFAGVTAALDGSTLIASLGNGTVVAYDVALRRWRWSYTYKYPDRPDRALAWMRRLPPRSNEANLSDSLLTINQWQDPRTLVSGSRVLVTPVDDDSLDCLDARTGKLLWTRPRDGSLYLAGVSNEVALVVGRSELQGVNMSDGSTLWNTAVPAPSGRGVRRGSHYTLPLSTSEMLTVDIVSGRVLARTVMPSGRPVGNLVAAPDLMLTQSASEIRAFRSRSAIEKDLEQRLAANPADSAALRIRGELELHAGETQAGERDLLTAVEASDKAARRTLAWSLLAGLKRDFDLYYPRLDEIRSLTDDPALLSQTWQAVAEGLNGRGEAAAAFLALVQSSEQIDDDANRLLDRGPLRVRERNLLRGTVTGLWQALSPTDKEKASEALRQQLASLPPTGSEFERALAVLPSDAAPVDLQLDRIAQGRLKPVTAEHRLLELRHSPDPQVSARANLQLIRLLLDEGRAPLPPSLLTELTGPQGDVTINGKQAAQALAEMLEATAVAERLERLRWPSEKPDVRPLTESAGITDYTSTAIVTGEMSELLEGWVFASDANSSSLVAFDSSGMFRWRESIPIRPQTPFELRISVCGRLLLLEASDSFRIFDAFSGQLLQTVSLYDMQSDIFGGRVIPRAGTIRPPHNRPVAPLTSRFVAYLEAPRFRINHPDDAGARLVLIEPLTRREIWSRPARNELEVLADDDFVVLVAGTGEMQPYHAADGRELPTSRIPEDWVLDRDFRVGIRRLITRSRNQSFELALFNPVTSELEWRLELPANSRYSHVDGRELAIYRPDGRFSLHDVATGQERWSASLDPAPDVKSMGIMSDAARLYIGTSTVATNWTTPPGQPRFSTVNAATSRFLIRGALVAINRQSGEIIWKKGVAGRHMDLRQPGSWPFLILASPIAVISDGPGEGTRLDRRMATLLQLLDRQTGEVVYEAELPVRESPHGWKSDPANGKISLRFGDGGIVLNFPKKPAEAPGQADPTSTASPASPPPPPVAQPLN